MEEEEDLGDYDDAFDWDSEEEEEEEIVAPPPLQIKGREVDPNAEEEVWDDDFEFGSDSSEVEEKIDLATSMVSGLVLQTKGSASPAPKGSMIGGGSQENGLATIASSGSLALKALSSSLDDLQTASPATSLISVLRDTLALIPSPPATLPREPQKKGSGINWENEFKKKDARVAEAQGKSDKIAEIKAYQDLAKLYKSEGEPKKALNQLNIAFKLFKDIPEDEKDSYVETELLCGLGELSNAQDDFLQAEDYLQAALEIATNNKYHPLLATINYQLGCTSITSDLPVRAGTYFCAHLNALLYKSKGDEKGKGKDKTGGVDLPWGEIGRSCFEIGKLLGNLEQKDLAIKFLKVAVNSLEGDLAAEAKSLLALFEPEKEDSSDELSGFADEEKDKDEESESEWSDWDAELGNTAGGNFGFSLGDLGDQEPKEEEKSLPSRYKLLNDELSLQYEIQKFPKPTALYSIQAEKGEQIHEARLIDFLTNIVTKRPLIHEEKLFSSVSVEELVSSFGKTISNYPKFSGTWANMYLDYCQTTYMNRRYEDCWKEIVAFFDAYQKHAHGDMQLGEEMMYLLQMLHIASKIWTAERDKAYCKILGIIIDFMPEARPLITILHAETYCHYGSQNLVPGKDGVPTTPLNALVEVYQELLGEEETQESSEEEEDSEKFDDSEEENWYSEEEEKEKKKDKKKKKKGKKDKKKKKEKEQPKSARKETVIPVGKYTLKKEDMMVMALTDMHLHLNFMSPLSTTQQQEPDFAEESEYFDGTENSEYDSDPDVGDGFGFDRTLSASDFRVVAKNTSEVWDLPKRMEKLKTLYPSVKHPFYKAKAAYVLGYYHEVSLGEKGVAETLFFECIYLLDMAPPVAKGMFPIVSELGTNALMRYADTALHNSKYTYAILAYHAALTNYHLRNQKDAYYSLLNRLGTDICPNNNDHPKALKYLEEMLFKYTTENKVNEMGNVLEWLIKQHMEIGQHSMAEQYIQEWHQLFAQLASATDARRIRVEIEAAKLYIETSQLERAIQILQSLMHLGSELLTDKKNIVQELLASAYIKKRWYVECSDVLDAMLGTGSLRTPRQSARVLSTGRSDQGLRGNSRYWQLRASNYYHANLLPEALVCVELAISNCEQSRLSTLGKYYSLRGKILRGLAALTLVTYPTTFPASNLDNDTRSFLMSTTSHNKIQLNDPTLYTCLGDVVQEAIATFDRAYDYYLAVNDDSRVAKSLARIAETYLSHLFAPVALLRIPYQERARLPAFHASPITRRGKEGEEENSSSAKPKKPAKEKEKAKIELDDSDDEDDDDDFELETAKDAFISFDSIEDPALYSLDIGAETCDILLLLTGYMNMAELRYLQDAISDSLTFWREFRDQLYVLFLDGPTMLVKSAPASFMEKLFVLVKRALRFMMCFDSELINKNLMLIDAFLLLQMDMEQAKKRPVYPIGVVRESDYRQQVLKVIGKPRERKPTTIFPTFTSDKPSFSGDSPKITLNSDDGSLEDNEGKEDVWGCLRCMRNFITKYNEGKILQQELLRRNRETLGKIGRLQHQQRLQNHRRRTASTVGGTLRRTVSKAGSAVLRPSVKSVNFGGSDKIQRSPRGGTSILPHSAGSTIAAAPIDDPLDGSLAMTLDPAMLGKNLARNKSTFFRVQEKVSSTYTYQEISHAGASSSGTASKEGGASGSSASSSNSDTSGGADGAGNTGGQREFMYILQVDDYMIFYVPSSGKKRIHRLGGKSHDSNFILSDKNSMLHLSVHLMADTSQRVTFAISPFTTLDTVLRQLCVPRERSNSISEAHNQNVRSAPSERILMEKGAGLNTDRSDRSSGGSSASGMNSSGDSDGSNGAPRKKKKFNSVSKMHSKITFLESTANFYAELSHWLEFFANKSLDMAGALGSGSGGLPNPSTSSPAIASPLTRTPPIKRGHRRSRSSTTSSVGQAPVNPLSFAFFAKKTVSEHRTSATFIPLTERMKGTIYECFTAQELNEASPAKPLRLYVYFSDTPPALAEMSSSKTTSVFGGNNRNITLSDNIHYYLTHLVTPHSPKLEGYIPNPQALSEMVDSVFSSLLEIMPSPSREGGQAISLDLPSSKPNTTGFFSHLKRLASSHELPERGSSKLYVSSNPLVLICSQSLQIFPWELLLGDLVVRSFSLHHLDRRTKLPPPGTTTTTNQLPKYICFYQGNKSLSTEESQREWLMDNVGYQLNLIPQAPFYSQRCAVVSPFHSPLVQKTSKLNSKSKRKFVSYCEVTDKMLEEPLLASKAVMAEAGPFSVPVCLFTYADLLDPHPVILSLLSKKNCTLLFIPASYIKPFTKLLKRTFTRPSKTNPVQPNLYHSLITSINTFQMKEKNFVPITMMNPPSAMKA